MTDKAEQSEWELLSRVDLLRGSEAREDLFHLCHDLAEHIHSMRQNLISESIRLSQALEERGEARSVGREMLGWIKRRRVKVSRPAWEELYRWLEVTND